MAPALEDDAEDMAGVSASVLELDQMTRQNAALVEESAAAAHAMDEQADRMNGLAARFSL